MRGYVGDVLAVAWVYLCPTTVLRTNLRARAVVALLMAYAVELSQYVALING